MNMKRTLLGVEVPKRTESALCAIIALAVIGTVTSDNGPGYMIAESDWYLARQQSEATARAEALANPWIDATNGIAIYYNKFEVTTNYASPGATWFDFAAAERELQREEPREITDEQAIEKLLGFKPKTDINFMKALLFMRETAETLGVGANIDWQTKIQVEVLRFLIDEKRKEMKQQHNSTNPFDPMADMNKKGTM